MKANKTCLVIDLDDTLYPEVLYKYSGFNAVEEVLFSLFGIRLDESLLEISRVNSDVFGSVCEKYGLSLAVKSDLVNIYRYHNPSIKLSREVATFLEEARSRFKLMVILTDGRSVTQRLKLNSLGLLDLPVYISDEWSSVKPDTKRFVSIAKDFPFCENFCYVGDNIHKDFIAPNKLGWFSVGLRDKGENVHAQQLDGIPIENMPRIWIDCLSELLSIYE
jgi:putative hydrolase of the HAD superfamily